MKRVLITGAKSKLGLAFQKYIEINYTHEKYIIECVSVRGEGWKGIDFSRFDVVLHCAGIFRAPSEDYSYYKEINVDLTEALAKKVSEDKAGQFIYLSTMDIYRPGKITTDTQPDPQSLYGKSKLEAEDKIKECLGETATKIAIIRCCPVIGKNAESLLEGYMKAFKLPLFPIMFTNDKRSILYVDTLCELIKMIIDEESEGVFFPQNLPPLSVAEILEIIKNKTNQKTLLFKIPQMLWVYNTKTERVFGSYYYEEKMSNHFDNQYIKIDSKTAIESIF